MVLRENDLVAVGASYHAKSIQIRELARQLNLDLGVFVFVDDNPVEMEEVSLELQAVSTLLFPSHDDGPPNLLIAFPARLSGESAEATLVSLVPSCRVIQRRVEHAFCAWRAERIPMPRTFAFAATDRDEPVQQFLRDWAFVLLVEGRLGWSRAFAAAHTDDLALFGVVQPVSD
jgi:predicted enzyme involved in methoxymalonyl-ACP biosynthesis